MSHVVTRFLRPVRASLPSSFSYFKPPGLVRVQSWVKGPESGSLSSPAAFQGRFLVRRLFDLGNYCRRGGKVGIGSAFGASLLVGTFAFRPRVTYSFDDEHGDLVGDSDEDDDQKVFWTFAGRIWLPVFFIITVLLNLDHPMQLALKIILLLLSTKPSPLSVYLFIEQSLHANKVEVRDYKFLCLARVEMKDDEKLTLVGILGGWWKLPLSHGNSAFLVLK